jgi:hypothetical protein
MSAAKILEGPAGYALAIGVGGLVIYLLWNKIGKTAGDAADGVGGLLTGKNGITKAARTDAYQGAGILGTLGAAVDNTLGGLPSRTGEALGGWLYDVLHPIAYNSATGLQGAAKTVANGRATTNAIWGPVGQVELRAV